MTQMSLEEISMSNLFGYSRRLVVLGVWKEQVLTASSDESMVVQRWKFLAGFPDVMCSIFDAP